MTVLPNWQVYSDGELARAAAAGDRQAFAAIYDRHADPRHDFCVGMLRNRDAASSAPPKNPPTTTGVRFCATGRPYPREPTPIKGVAMNAKIIGNVMPVLVVTLNRGETLIAESGDLSWMTLNQSSCGLRPEWPAHRDLRNSETHGRRPRLVHAWVLRA